MNQPRPLSRNTARHSATYGITWRQAHLHLPVSVPQALELCAQQTHQGGPQAAAGDQVLHHEGRKQVDVERGAVQPMRPSGALNSLSKAVPGKEHSN